MTPDEFIAIVEQAEKDLKVADKLATNISEYLN